jgi:intracellular multiplication protein IcmD
MVSSSLLTAWQPTTALAEPAQGAPQPTEQFGRALLRDAQVQELAQSIVDHLPAATQQQFKELAELIASGATPEEVRQFAHSIVVPAQVLQLIEQLIIAAFYVGGLGLAVAAIAKFKAHKSNPTQASIVEGVALTSIAAALLFLPTLLGSSGETLFALGPN